MRCLHWRAAEPHEPQPLSESAWEARALLALAIVHVLALCAMRAGRARALAAVSRADWAACSIDRALAS